MKQLKGIKIYDNGGKTFDRYTVFIDNYSYGMSDNPTMPNEFNMYTGEYPNDIQLGKHLGKLVPIMELPDEVKQAIFNRLIV